MIDSGVKLEEYREMKQFWFKRLTTELKGGGFVFKKFDVIEFQHGYQPDSRRMTFELKGIDCIWGKQEWGAKPGEIYFVIKLGKRL